MLAMIPQVAANTSSGAGFLEVPQKNYHPEAREWTKVGGWRVHDREEFELCASRLKALADPERLRIVNLLLQGQKSVSQLADDLAEPIDKVSHHLGVLRGAHLVTTERQGKFVIYSVTPEVQGETSQGTQLDLGCCRLELE